MRSEGMEVRFCSVSVQLQSQSRLSVRVSGVLKKVAVSEWVFKKVAVPCICFSESSDWLCMHASLDVFYASANLALHMVSYRNRMVFNMSDSATGNRINRYQRRYFNLDCKHSVAFCNIERLCWPSWIPKYPAATTTGPAHPSNPFISIANSNGAASASTRIQHHQH